MEQAPCLSHTVLPISPQPCCIADAQRIQDVFVAGNRWCIPQSLPKYRAPHSPKAGPFMPSPSRSSVAACPGCRLCAGCTAVHGADPRREHWPGPRSTRHLRACCGPEQHWRFCLGSAHDCSAGAGGVWLRSGKQRLQGGSASGHQCLCRCGHHDRWAGCCCGGNRAGPCMPVCNTARDCHAMWRYSVKCRLHCQTFIRQGVIGCYVLGSRHLCGDASVLFNAAPLSPHPPCLQQRLQHDACQSRCIHFPAMISLCCCCCCCRRDYAFVCDCVQRAPTRAA